MTGATLDVGVRSRAVPDAGLWWQAALPLLVPCGLLLAGGGVGFLFTLDAAVAAERLLGLVVDTALALVAMLVLRRVERPVAWLVAASTLAWLGAVWVIAASGPDAFRGSLGVALQRVFRPVFGLARVTDSVDVANTRFIVGYNGLADLCLAAIFCCGAVLMARPRARLARAALLGAIGVSFVVLVGAGSRGGLTGLAAGVCMAGLFVWRRRFALIALTAAPLGLIVAAAGMFDKGLEFSSTAGRLTYWGDLCRLLVEYPLTGTGLGVDTANRVALQYQINPDPERVFYAHNTYVQSYLEMGPLGTLGMLGVPLIALTAALVARRDGATPARRALLIAGLGVIGGLTAHGLTDQVVTTNVGTGLLLLGLAAVLAALRPASLAKLASGVRRATLAAAGVAAVAVLVIAATPSGRAQVLLNIGGLQLNQALALEPQTVSRLAALAESERTFALALTQDSGHPAVLRDLAGARSAHYDDAGALNALQQAAGSARLDAFDMLQIARVYRDLGFAEDAYAWAARAYASWQRPPEDAVMQVYAQSTLAVLDDDRARTLADQAEAAMRARTFGTAVSLFQQALTFKPASAYLQDRLGAAQRAVAKYGG
ncbi:MAG: O-antigen ligase family protein [Chloroflexota bacterium]|nr:O-antigen ligase family protein [Chloroflexota bacterium]